MNHNAPEKRPYESPGIRIVGSLVDQTLAHRTGQRMDHTFPVAEGCTRLS
jgi:hypothetical protein